MFGMTIWSGGFFSLRCCLWWKWPWCINEEALGGESETPSFGSRVLKIRLGSCYKVFLYKLRRQWWSFLLISASRCIKLHQEATVPCTDSTQPCATCSKAAPEHYRASFMCHSKYGVLFFVCFIIASVNIELMWLAKKLQLCLIGPKDILPKALWLVNMYFGKVQSCFFMIFFHQWCPSWSSSIKSTLAQTVMMVRLDTDFPWPWSSPLISLEVVPGSLVRIHIIHLFNFSSIFFLQEVGYSPMNRTFPNNMSNWSHRNIKLLGNGLIAFTFNMIVFKFLSNLFLAFCGPCSLWYRPWYETTQWLLFTFLNGSPITSLKTPVMLITGHGLTCPYGQIIFKHF